MVDKQEILRLLNKYFKTTGEITIDDRGFVNCKGNVTLKERYKHKRLPVFFDRVDGGFWGGHNKLETLAGAPNSVGDDFSCYDNQLTSLEHAPKSVDGRFDCSHNKLTSLKHAPQSVAGSFNCSNNQLTSLKHAPQSVGGDFNCRKNELTSLEHCPQSVNDSFDCSFNNLTTLEHAPKSVAGHFWCFDNKLTSLEGLPAVHGTLYLSYSPTLPLLRCLLAKKVEFFPKLPSTVETIFNRYAGKGKRVMFDCQKELEDAGFLENARW